MTQLTRRFALAAVMIGTLAGSSVFGGVQADEVSDWPNRPVTFVFPYPAGSGTDNTLRKLADFLSTKFKQQFIVENRAGANGSIGTAYAAKAKPDGYTLAMVTPGPGANNLNTYPNLGYHPINDFTHIAQITSNEMVIVARGDLPVSNLKDLAALAKKEPGKISAGNPGVGSYAHMLQLTYADLVGVTFTYVPYRGTAPIVTDLLSGSVDIAMDYHSPNYQQQIESGKIKVLGFATTKRNEQNPNVMTFAEQGVNFVAAPWSGLIAPKGTPDGIVRKINAAVVEWLKMPDTIAFIKQNGALATSSTPEEFRALSIEEEKKWRDTIKKYDIRSN